MEIHAYDEEYMPLAQRVMGDMFDFALRTVGLDDDWFCALFTCSDISKQIACGNPAYVAGHNGCELARMVIKSSGLEISDEIEDVMFIDKSREFWVGWSLAFYQWKSGHSFSDILETVHFDELISMYAPYHEMDVTEFSDAMDEKMNSRRPETRLQFYRKNLGISQSELSVRSGVPLRQIQLFEQRQRSINNTQANCLLRLSKALSVDMETLLER